MSTGCFAESDVEDAALAWLEANGWQVAHDPDMASDELGAERADYGETVLGQRLRDALVRLNPDLPSSALDDALRGPDPPGRGNAGGA